MIIQKENLRQRLMGATVASCSCMTKTPNIEYHDEKCLYRILVEAVLFVERSPIEQIDVLMKCTWIQCQNEAVNKVHNVQYNTVLGHNCEEHTPKPSPQRDKDYIITELIF